MPKVDSGRGLRWRVAGGGSVEECVGAVKPQHISLATDSPIFLPPAKLRPVVGYFHR